MAFVSPDTRPLFRLFSSFQTNTLQFLQQIYGENVNPVYKSHPIITRPGLGSLNPVIAGKFNCTNSKVLTLGKKRMRNIEQIFNKNIRKS